MRLLLISDTHGKLDIINELSAQTQADAVIHAGDFGFYEDESFERLSDRELRLHATHSDLPRAEKDNLLALSRIDLIAQARMLRLLGEFRSYIDGGNSFQVPVYAVWGNHEDKDVVERLFNGDVTIANLHMLHHRQGYRVGPGKEPLVELIGARTRADYTISGHMGAPTCMVWNPFAVSSVDEAQQRLREGLAVIKNACAQPIPPWAENALSSVEQIAKETIAIGIGKIVLGDKGRIGHINIGPRLKAMLGQVF